MTVPATPAPARLPAPPSSAAAELAATISLLLRTGRSKMAGTLLERLPAAIRDELVEQVGVAGWAGYQRGFEAGRAALAREIAGSTPPPRHASSEAAE